MAKKLFHLILTSLLLGCTADRAPGALFGPAAEPALVVDALLIVGQPLPLLYLRRTAAPGAVYDREVLAVSSAQVLIRQGRQEFAYQADPDSAGRYLPTSAPKVQAQATYDLEVQVENRQLRARTTTPPQLRVSEALLLDEQALTLKNRLKLFREVGNAAYAAPENQLRYLDGLLEVRFAPVQAAGYQVAIFSLDPASPFLVDADFVGDQDAGNFERQGNSPPLAATAEGKVSLPWFAVAYGGRHLFKVYALDQNWYDYTRTNPAENPGFGGGLAGDSFERPLFPIEGGIGLFGSASVDSVGFFVLPRN